MIMSSFYTGTRGFAHLSREKSGYIVGFDTVDGSEIPRRSPPGMVEEPCK